MLKPGIPVTPNGRKDMDLEKQWHDQIENGENGDDVENFEWDLI